MPPISESWPRIFAAGSSNTTVPDIGPAPVIPHATRVTRRPSCGEPRAVTVKRGSEPVNPRSAPRADGLRLKLAEG